MKIILCDMAVDTTELEFCKLNSNAKINMLRIALEKLKKQYLTQQPEYGYFTPHQKICAILIAPEYFFANNHEVNGIRQHSEQEAREIEVELVKLSVEYPKILLIPGTIAWQKKALATPEKLTTILTSNCTFEQIHTEEKLNQENYKNYRESRGLEYSEQQYIEYYKRSGDAKLLKAREVLSLTDPNNIGRAPKSTAPLNDIDTKLSQLAPENKLGMLYLSRNTAYFYLNGKRVYKYNKHSDFQEVLDHNSNVFIPGLKQPPMVTIEGITFGIEICLDHNCGVLAKYITSISGEIHPESQKRSQGADIHLILSASVENKEENVKTNKEGCLIHSSSFWKSRRYGTQKFGYLEDNNPQAHHRFLSLQL